MDEHKSIALAAYCRVSTERQRDEKTIESQKMEIDDWAKANDVTIVQWYVDDGWSGDMLARPELDRLRDDADKGLWGGVIFADRDRLARRYSYQELIIEELTEKGLEVQFIHQAKAETPEDKILQGFQGLFAEYERVKITERMRRGKIHKAREKKLVGHQAPYGYSYILKTQDKDGYFEVNEPEAEIIRMIFQWVADKGYSMHRVVKELFALGIKPAKVKKPYWPKSSIARLLNREDYIGISYYNRREAIVPKNPIRVEKYRRVKKTSRRVRPREEWLPIPVPPIIEKELFERAHQRMRENFLYHKRNKHYPYLLTGKVFCACGTRRVGDGVNGHHYYRCAHAVYKFPLPSKCPYEGVNAEILDAMTWNKLLELFAQKSLIKSQAQRWSGKQDKTVDKSKEGTTRLKSALEKLTDEEKRYVRAFGSKVIDFEQFKENMREVKAKKEAIELQVKEYNERVPDDVVNLDSFEDICDTLYYSMKHAPASDRQEHIRNLIVSIYVGERRSALVNGRIPLLAQAQNIQYEPISRFGWFTQRREVDAF